MKVLTRLSSTITEHAITLRHKGKTYVYKEFLNDKNRVTDCELRTESGHAIEDPAFLEEVQEFVDKLPNLSVR